MDIICTLCTAVQWHQYCLSQSSIVKYLQLLSPSVLHARNNQQLRLAGAEPFEATRILELNPDVLKKIFGKKPRAASTFEPREISYRRMAYCTGTGSRESCFAPSEVLQAKP